MNSVYFIWFQSINLTATALLLNHEKFLEFLQSDESIGKPSEDLIHYLMKKNRKLQFKYMHMMWVINIHDTRLINLLTFTCKRTFDSSIGHAKTAFITPPVQPARNTWLNQYFCFNSLFGVLLRRKQSI